MKEFTKLILYSLCIFNLVACTNKNIKLIKQAVADTNAECPIEGNYLLTLERAKYLPPKTIVFYYTINLNLFNSNTDDLKESLKTDMINDILYNEYYNSLKNIGVSFRYIYTTQVGKKFADYTIDSGFYWEDHPEYRTDLTDDEVYKLLEKEVSAYNPQLPRQIGRKTELYKINPIFPRTLEYVYRYNTVERNSIDTSYLRSNVVKDDFVASIRDQKSVDKQLKDNKVTFRYTYVDKHNIPITSIDVTPRDYK